MTKAMLVGILALGAGPLAWGAEAKANLVDELRALMAGAHRAAAIR